MERKILQEKQDKVQKKYRIDHEERLRQAQIEARGRKNAHGDEWKQQQQHERRAGSPSAKLDILKRNKVTRRQVSRSLA